jgi:hypothetical protein
LLHEVTKQRFATNKELKEGARQMNKNMTILIAGAAAVLGFGLGYVVKSNSSAPATSEVQGTIGKPVTQVDQLNPFTNVAAIPATVDPATIRFEKLRQVELASKTKTTTDTEKCKEGQFRESDPTCQTVTVLEKVKAIEARYSYAGPAMSTGETVLGRDQFSVYFRPEDLAAVGSIEKLNREQAGSLFDVSTSRPVVQAKLVDKEHSKYCDGNYVDGNWVRKDASCQDQVVYINQMVPSTNLLVQVDVRRPAAMATH